MFIAPVYKQASVGSIGVLTPFLVQVLRQCRLPFLHGHHHWTHLEHWELLGVGFPLPFAKYNAHFLGTQKIYLRAAAHPR